jgi:hypothetical protein
MLTWMALLALLLQDPPRSGESRRPQEPGERRPREGEPLDLEARERAAREKIDGLRKRLESLPPEGEEAKALVKELEAQGLLLRRMREFRVGEDRPPGEGRAPRPPEPPRPPPGPRGPGGESRRPAENPDLVREWLKENEPETFRRMTQAQDEGRRPDVTQILSEAEPRMRQMNEMKERDPKGYERVREMRRLDGESHELADRARRTEAPDERERLSRQLAENLAKLFDLREENRARDLSELKGRVLALEKELSNRKANKEKIVDQRRRELLGAKGEFDW